jgi:cation diffusion facilitator family transporter
MNPANTRPILGRDERRKVIDRTNWMCVAVDAIAFVIKIVVGVTVKSPALIADAMHSLSDLAADVPLIILAKVSHHDADDEHPYGHARFETLGTVMLGALLLAVAAGIAYESTLLFFGESRPEPSLAALITIIIALALKEGLEINFLGLSLGIDPWHLGIKLPGIGQLSLRNPWPQPSTTLP